MKNNPDPPAMVPASTPVAGPIDGRTKAGRKFNEMVESIVSYLGEEPTPAELALAERAAALSMRLDVLNMKLIAGEEIDTAEQCRLGGAMLNALDALGVTPFKRRRHSW